MKYPIVAVLTLWCLFTSSGFSAKADFEAAEKAYDQGDYATALSEYKADGGPRSLNSIGLMYFHGDGVNVDKREAALWFRKGAESGNPEAQLNYAQMLESGDGVERDLHQAAKWYRKAANQGSEEARQALEHIYRLTEGIKTRWYRKDAERGIARAQ